MIESFTDYIVQRQDRWKKKYIDNLPREEHEVFSRYHLCNVYRECDEFSKYIISKCDVIEDLIDRFVFICYARVSLSKRTSQVLFSSSDVSRDLQKQRDTGFPIAGAALQPAVLNGLSIVESMVHLHETLMSKEFREKAEIIFTSIDDPHALSDFVTMNVPLVGKFRSYEIITDLTYLPESHSSENDFIHVGPGSKKNLEMLSEELSLRDDSIDALLFEMKSILRDKNFFFLPHEYQGSKNIKEDEKFTFRTLEDCLCEFRKYENFLNGRGRRRIYRENNAIFTDSGE